MEELIKQAFLHVDVIGPQVQVGYYDLVGPNGEIILPQVWDKVVEPDWQVTMHMWPMDRLPPAGPMGGRPGGPGGPFAPGGMAAHARMPPQGVMRPGPGPYQHRPPGPPPPPVHHHPGMGPPRPMGAQLPPRVVNAEKPPTKKPKKGQAGVLAWMVGKPPSKGRK